MTDSERNYMLYAFARHVSVRDSMGVVYTKFSLALQAITDISEESLDHDRTLRLDLWVETIALANSWMNAIGLPCDNPTPYVVGVGFGVTSEPPEPATLPRGV